MIERIADMPPGTIGFRVEGDVEREDYRELLAPELRAVLESGQGLRTLYLMDDLDELEPGAMWEDAKLGFDTGVRHRGEWVRSAIVTDVYPVARLEEAKRWVAGDPA